MGLNKNKTFVRKPSSTNLYKWSPCTTDKKGVKITLDGNVGCTAVPRSQGEDWIVRYVSEITIDEKGQQHKYAYVACDYVK